MPPAIEVERVSRRFKVSARQHVDALEDVSFAVAEGEVVGLLGTNGAGKTTLTKILATLLLPSEGTARVMGHDVRTATREVRLRTGVVLGGDRGLYNRINARENLAFFGMLAGVRRSVLEARIPELLDQVGLGAAADRRVETYSKGMRQRLHVAIGLVARPRVLLLDEPTVGLDPVEADRLRGTIAQLRDDGVTVLLTSHLLLDVERLADRVVLLDHGRVTADLPLRDFAARAGYAAVVVVRYRGTIAGRPDAADVALTERGPDDTGASTAELRLQRWGPHVFDLLARLLRDVEVEDIDVRPARLDEAFSAAVDRGMDAKRG